MPTFDTPEPVRLRVTMSTGQLTITAADTAQSKVEVSASPDDEVGRDLVAQTSVEHRDGEISVTTPRHSSFFGRRPELTVTATVPTRSSLLVRTESADVEARGAFGRAQIETASGDVELDTVTELRVRTASGDVRVHEMREDGEISTGSGDVRVDAVHGPLGINSASGDVEIAEAHDGLNVNTASGDVQLLHAQRGPVQANTASGDVHVGVALGTTAWLDVQTLSGEVYSDLDGAEEPGEHADTLRLQIKTASGDITLVHA